MLLAVAWGVPWVRSTTSALTATAQRERLRLADGSVAVLNASTRLRTDFRHGRRVVELESGEAFFSVVKDKAHPFYVRTPRGVVRVTGTAFNVRLTEEAAPEVTLIEGGVSVTGLGPERRLVPGQQFDPRSGNVQTLTPVRLAAAIAWREGRLVLDGLTLGEAAGRMADFHGKKILIAPQVAGLTMGGSCSLDDLPAFLEFLPRALSVSVLPTSDGSWRVMARQ
ncbi:MAG: FecR domain-containing protein [Lacunisphaera sp.]